MVYREGNGEAYSLDFRETAPAKAHRDMYLDESGEVIPLLSRRGPLYVGVPGSVEGMFQAHARFGSLSWTELLQPAVDLARQGYEVSVNQADWLNKAEEDFRLYNPDGAYLVKDSGWAAGDSIRQADLAATLERIRDQGRDGFYQGKTAEFIVDEMQRGGGWISREDLANYEAKWRDPVQGTYKNHQVISMGPPSSGGIVLLQMLKMVEDHPLAQWGFQDPRTVHLMVEAERRAFADRAEFLGDPDFWNVPLKELLDMAYLKSRMASFDPEKATDSESLSHGVLPKESTETTHYSIVDLHGNAVSITTTLNSAYGSRVWVQQGGFLLNNEMDDFSAKPGEPNLYGLIGNEANAIVAKKRMLSSMTPTIIAHNGKLKMVLGTPGGSTIITSVFQCFLNVVEFGMTMRESVNQPRFHSQWLPDKLYVEETALSESCRAQLKSKGHEITERDAIGRVNAILVHPDGMFEGAGDHRRDDKAMGF